MNAQPSERSRKHNASDWPTVAGKALFIMENNLDNVIEQMNLDGLQDISDAIWDLLTTQPTDER